MTDEAKKSGCGKTFAIVTVVLGAIAVGFVGCVGLIGYNYTSQETEQQGESVIKDTSWVPKGFKAFNNQVAFKWSDSGTYKCSYAEKCIQIEVVPKEGCGFLYAELTKNDKAGNNVGFTNETTSNVAAGQKALLLFETYGDFDTFQLSKISCS